MEYEYLKLDILKFFEGITMNEEEHRYYYEGKTFNYSVSGVIKNFYIPFNAKEVSERKSRETGVPAEKYREEWDNKRDNACHNGHERHKFGEVYPFNRHLKPRTKQEEAIVKFWNDLPDYIVPVMTEVMMWHKKFLFAGTADILLYNLQTGEYIIADYKTNEDLFKNYKGKENKWQGKRMIRSFSHLLDHPYSHYEIQLSLYQILLEQVPGIKVSSRKIIWLGNDGEYKMYSTTDYTDVLLNKELLEIEL